MRGPSLEESADRAALGSELADHPGYPSGGTKPDDTTNHRNGTSGKTLLTDDGPVAIAVPRDREGTLNRA
jgi:putative transposase